MAKVKSKWVCQSCGYETVSYLGRCPECNKFGTFVEEITSTTSIIHSNNNDLTALLGCFLVDLSNSFFIAIL